MTDFNQKTHDTDVGSHGGQSRQMMEVFENQEFGSIRVLQEAGKTFFCASDVAKALGYVNPYAAVKRHCRGWRYPPRPVPRPAAVQPRAALHPEEGWLPDPRSSYEGT